MRLQRTDLSAIPIQIMNENRFAYLSEQPVFLAYRLLFSIPGAIYFLHWLTALITAKTALPLYPGIKSWFPRKSFLSVLPCQPSTILHSSFLKSSI